MTIGVYLEVGTKRVFAGAIDWPGWCRSAKNEDTALEALLAYGKRYETILEKTSLGFHPPASLLGFSVVERLKGNATTDFGAPAGAPRQDSMKVGATDLARHGELLRACWAAFDAAVRAARGKTLGVGPRGGGRDVAKLVGHVMEAERAYLAALGWPAPPEKASRGAGTPALRKAVSEGMRASARGEIPSEGPRGGKRWPPRYFVRRAAWHLLDHAWEIEDRLR